MHSEYRKVTISQLLDVYGEACKNKITENVNIQTKTTASGLREIEQFNFL